MVKGDAGDQAHVRVHCRRLGQAVRWRVRCDSDEVVALRAKREQTTVQLAHLTLFCDWILSVNWKARIKRPICCKSIAILRLLFFVLVFIVVL